MIQIRFKHIYIINQYLKQKIIMIQPIIVIQKEFKAYSKVGGYHKPKDG